MTPTDRPTASVHSAIRPPDPQRDWAYFLDFDGTLVDIAPTPDAIVVAPRLTAVLGDVLQATGGALMVVSGRPLSEIDRFLAPLRLPAAAQHGGERRYPDGRVERPPADPGLSTAAERLRSFCADRPGALMEEKHSSVTLHYRGAPDVASEALAVMENIAAQLGSRYRLLRGKMVLELKPESIDKGRAIAAVMEEAPFAGRRPVMVGDDRTDEDGFLVVNARGGVSVHVGTSLADSAARYLLTSPAAVRAWLGRLSE